MRKTTAAILTALALACLPAAAQEQPHNDPLAILSNRPRPNVLMLIDTSGSMLWDSDQISGSDITVRLEDSLRYAYAPHYTYNFGSDSHKVYLIDSDHPESRIGQAKAAIREISSQIPDINLGIGRFRKSLVLNRFRADVPSGLDQDAVQPNWYNYEYWDGQLPVVGQINVPYRRAHVGAGNPYEYAYARVVRRYNEHCGPIYRMWTIYDPTDVVWSTDIEEVRYIGGELYIRLNWWTREIEDSRYMQYRALGSSGEQIFRDSYASPDATHRNKLNQVDNIDIFISDSEFLMLKENTQLGDPLSANVYVAEVYGVPVDQTLTFYYYPTVADWDGTTSCAGGEILVDVQDRFQDDFDTPQDESDNKEQVAATAGPITTNALIYDFTVEPVELTDLGPFFGMGGTALGSTLEAATAFYRDSVIPRDQDYNVAHCRDNFVILLTDGYETCGGVPESAASYLYNDLGIKVYVIAFVTTTAQADAIAAAGGTEVAFRADNKEELIEALKNIFAEIQTSVQLAAPVAASSTRQQESVVEGDVALLPYFDFPGFEGHLQARRIFKICVVAVDPSTGDILLDGSGEAVIIEDDISEARVLELTNDPDNPIDQDPAREIVGIQIDPPAFSWDAGELLSLPFIETEDPEFEYQHLQQDYDDLDGDGDTSEEIVNPAYRTADERRIFTTLSFAWRPEVIEFDEATLIDDEDNRDEVIPLLGVEGWSEEEIRFLVNYVRGKTVRRFAETTEIYGYTFNPGDPMPNPDSEDGNGDGIPDGFLYSERQWKLGDIVGSTPAVVIPPMGTYPIEINDNDNSLHDYDEFAEANSDIPSVAIIGANDGMLHAFSFTGIDLNDDGDFEDTGEFYPGQEIWAFVPPDLMGKQRMIYSDSEDDDDFEPDGQLMSPHSYFVDAMSTLAIVRARFHDGDTDGDGSADDPEFRIMFLTGEGRGGNYYWALDVTDPLTPVPVWSLTDPTMGLTLSRPAVGPVQTGDSFAYYAFMGSGFDYDQVDGSADVGNILYQVDVNDGSILNSFHAGDAAGGAGIPNAIVGRAIMVDDDDDFLVERVYCGDLDGNIWRWDLTSGFVTNILEASPEPLTTADDRLERPILDSLTYANIFGFDVVSAATGGDTRRYIDEQGYRINYTEQRVYMLVDTDREGRVASLLNGRINEEGDYEETGDTIGVDLPPYRVAENIPVVTAFTEYDEAGRIYRGFQTFYPLYTPDPAGLRSIRCSFGSSDLLVLDSIFSESSIVESTQGTVIDMGEGKATGITYVGGNILFSIGDQFKVYGQGIYRFESTQRVQARIKVLQWREVF